MLAAVSGVSTVRSALKSTFSICAVDTARDEVGCAVQSRYFAVGSVVPWAKAGVGAVATQAAGVAACLAGDISSALAHVRRALELDAGFRSAAAADSDFAALAGDAEFRALVGA